jgi:uncharacterized small protein (DUF1192 family)
VCKAVTKDCRSKSEGVRFADSALDVNEGLEDALEDLELEDTTEDADASSPDGMVVQLDSGSSALLGERRLDFDSGLLHGALTLRSHPLTFEDLTLDRARLVQLDWVESDTAVPVVAGSDAGAEELREVLSLMRDEVAELREMLAGLRAEIERRKADRLR